MSNPADSVKAGLEVSSVVLNLSRLNVQIWGSEAKGGQKKKKKKNQEQFVKKNNISCKNVCSTRLIH